MINLPDTQHQPPALRECEACGNPTKALHRCLVCEDEVCSGCGSIDEEAHGFICTSCAEWAEEETRRWARENEEVMRGKG